jgi:hypothetical protein
MSAPATPARAPMAAPIKPAIAELTEAFYTPNVLEEVFSELYIQDTAYNVVSKLQRARSSAHPRLVWDFYNLWRCIDIRARECSTAEVDLDRTTHVSCVALHSPVSGVANPGPCPYPRRRAFPYWVSSASSDRESWLCWRGLEGAGPISGGRRAPEAGWHMCA